MQVQGLKKNIISSGYQLTDLTLTYILRTAIKIHAIKVAKFLNVYSIHMIQFNCFVKIDCSDQLVWIPFSLSGSIIGLVVTNLHICLYLLCHILRKSDYKFLHPKLLIFADLITILLKHHATYLVFSRIVLAILRKLSTE